MQGVSTEISAGTPQVSSDGEDDSGSDSPRREEKLPGETGRKGSVVTTTTISQTFVSSEHPTASLARAMSAGEEETSDREEALEALGSPPLARGLLLLAEMSSEGNLLTSEYTRKCVQAARENKDFVLGYISQRSLNEGRDNFLSLTPGVSLPSATDMDKRARKGDGLGQQYRTPESAVKTAGCDIIIVGRGIIESKNRAAEAERYRQEAWKAYESKIGRAKK